MADKEEKVAIVKSPCYIHNKKTVFKNCMTRSEAIVKMAKALCNWYYTACSECALKDKPKECFRLLKDASFYEQAESALNALLEEHK